MSSGRCEKEVEQRSGCGAPGGARGAVNKSRRPAWLVCEHVTRRLRYEVVAQSRPTCSWRPRTDSGAQYAKRWVAMPGTPPNDGRSLRVDPRTRATRATDGFRSRCASQTAGTPRDPGQATGGWEAGSGRAPPGAMSARFGPSGAAASGASRTKTTFERSKVRIRSRSISSNSGRRLVR